MNARPLSVVLVLVGLALCLGEGRAAERPGPQPRPEFYTEAELVGILARVFAHWQGDKSEKLIFITADGQVFTFGNANPRGVSIKLPDIIRALARNGQNLGAVTNVVHNHIIFKPGDDFSPADRTADKTLRKHGFMGKFQIFYPITGHIKTLNRRNRERP